MPRQPPEPARADTGRAQRVALLLALGVMPPAMATEELSPQRQQALLNLLRQDCGSCHGMSLRGGLGPALLPESLAGKAEPDLVTTILEGRPGTAMPPWASFLSRDEAVWLVTRLRGGLEKESP